jgi:hypothetical protein
MKLSEFGWYVVQSSFAGETAQAMRRGGPDGETFAIVEPAADDTWVAVVNLHRNASGHERLECDSELEAILAAEHWLDELIIDATTT